MKKLSFLIIALVTVLFAGCASHPQIDRDAEAFLYPAESYIPQNFDWQPVAPGISRFDFSNSAFPIIYHVVRIDLTTPGLQLLTFPDKAFAMKKSGTKEGEKLPQPFAFKGIRTKAFAKKNNCLVAVNATPFTGKNGKWDLAAHISAGRQLVGIHIDQGFEISAPEKKYAALLFSKDQQGYLAAIIDSQNEAALQNCDYAFGGFYTVLSEGQFIDFAYRSHDSRTGCGISQDGRILYIMVAEGEVQNKSEGLSFPQCAEIFKAMGCHSALEFDGGGSSQLCINGKSVLSYNKARVQGNSFGFVWNEK